MSEEAIIALLQSLKSSAVIVLYLLVYGHARAKRISQDLSMDYETTRHHLRELHELGAVEKSRQGWGVSEGLKSAVIPRLKRGNTALFPLTTTTINTDSINESEVVVVEVKSAEIPRLKRGNTALSEHGQANLDAMQEVGIHPNTRTRALAECEWVTPEYIRAHVKELKKGRDRKGLAILRMEQGEEVGVEMQSYINGEYAEFIN